MQCTARLNNLILKHSVLPVRVTLSVWLLLIKFFSFELKWLPAVPFHNLCHALMFLPPFSLSTSQRLPALQYKKEGGGKNPPKSSAPQQQQSDDLVSVLFCWVRNWGLGEGGWGMQGEKNKREKESERWHREKAGSYFYSYRFCGFCSRCCVWLIRMK